MIFLYTIGLYLLVGFITNLLFNIIDGYDSSESHLLCILIWPIIALQLAWCCINKTLGFIYSLFIRR